MSWSAAFTPEPRAGGPMPQPPEDGILVAAHPPGRLGLRWVRVIEAVPAEARDRVARGRNHARRGRVRLLEVGPGAATAEVVAEVEARPVVRVRAFHRSEWDTLLDLLRAELDLLASLLEGELPERLLERLEGAGVHLIPTRKDLSFDCDCGDFVAPCTHAAALGHVLGDVMDGDPFQLLALRGRTREQIVAELREGWGDRFVGGGEVREEEPPAGDWLGSPGGVPDFHCSVGDALVAKASGLRALGPVPGAADLLPALAPLYEAGGRAALAVVEAAVQRAPMRRGSGRGDGVDTSSPWAVEIPVVSERPQGAQAPVVEEAAPRIEDPAPVELPVAVAEGVVEISYDEPPAPVDPVLALLVSRVLSTQDIADQLGLRVSEARRRLADLLKHKQIVRQEGPAGQVSWRLPP